MGCSTLFAAEILGLLLGDTNREIEAEKKKQNVESREVRN